MQHPYPVGTRVKKIGTKPGEDAHQDGARATVIETPSDLKGVARATEGHGYFVEWDDTPGVAVWVTNTRVEYVAGDPL